MAYSVAWDESVPAGNTDARFLDDRMRDRQTAIRERLCDIFGGLTLLEWQADPIKLKGIRGGGDADFEVVGGTATTTIKDSTGTNNDLQVNHATGDTTARRDFICGRYISALGGFRYTLSGWQQIDLAATVAATEIVRATGRPLMLRTGSILSIAASLGPNQFVTAGTITCEVWKTTINPNDGTRTDVATGLIVVLSTTINEKAFKMVTQAQDADTFAAGDEIWVKYATSGTLTPAGSLDLSVAVEVET